MPDLSFSVPQADNIHDQSLGDLGMNSVFATEFAAIYLREGQNRRRDATRRGSSSFCAYAASIDVIADPRNQVGALLHLDDNGRWFAALIAR